MKEALKRCPTKLIYIENETGKCAVPAEAELGCRSDVENE